MKIRIFLKGGADFTVKCGEFNMTKNGLGEFVGYNIKGIEENKPLYLDFSEVAAIVRVLSDE